MTSAPHLIHERLHAGHDRRPERRASTQGPVAWRSHARGTIIGYIRIAEHVGVIPRPVGGKHRDIGQVSNAIVWVAKDPLPAWLLPARACAVGGLQTSDGVAVRSTRGAVARPTAAGDRVEKVLRGAGAKATGTIGGLISEVGIDQRAGAGVVPGDLRHIAQGRAEVRPVAWRPVIRVSSGVSVAEVCSPNGNVVRCRRKSVYRDAGLRGNTPQGVTRKVTSGRPIVRRCHEDGHSLQHGLQVDRLVGSIERCSVLGLAGGVAEADDRRNVGLIHEVL